MAQIRVNPVMVAHFKLPADMAVDAAMRQWHERNPAGYHWSHKHARPCPFDVECPFGAK